MQELITKIHVCIDGYAPLNDWKAVDMRLQISRADKGGDRKNVGNK